MRASIIHLVVAMNEDIQMHILILRQARQFARLTALLALMTMNTAAQAASFVASWDARFNEEFSDEVNVDVGWRGAAQISVDDECVISGGTVLFFTGINFACGGRASLDSYTLEFYDRDDNSILDGIAGVPPGLPYVTEIRFADNALILGAR